MKYEVLFMRGDRYIVEASSAGQAHRKVVQAHRECHSYDILEIKKIRPELTPGR